MRVFVTGGTSFIGGHVVPRLVSEGHEVTVLARNPRKIPGLPGLGNVTVIEGDLDSDELIRESLHGQDALIHIALGAGATARERISADTVPTVRIFETAAEVGVRHLIHTSTVGVYDQAPGRYGDDTPPKPSHIYGATKAADESYLFAIASSYGVQANVIRPGYTFGAPEVDGAPIQSMPELPAIVGAVVAGAPVRVTKNTGLQFIWAQDLARVYSAVLTSSVNRSTFTCLSEAFITWETIARWAAEELDSASEIIITDEGDELAELSFDVSAIEREFGLRFDAEQPLRSHLRYLAAVRD